MQQSLLFGQVTEAGQLRSTLCRTGRTPSSGTTGSGRSPGRAGHAAGPGRPLQPAGGRPVAMPDELVAHQDARVDVAVVVEEEGGGEGLV